MMKRGSSTPWWDVLEEMTDGRTNRIDAYAILEYFRPLHDWLRKQNLTTAGTEAINDDDWQCEGFLDRRNSKVKSYETRSNEIFNTANQKTIFSKYVLLFSLLVSITLKISL